MTTNASHLPSAPAAPPLRQARRGRLSVIAPTIDACRLAPQLTNARHLQSFLAVCETGTIERASTLLFRAKSSVVRSIRELESHLDAPLFERTQGVMACTASGQVLRQRAQAALRAFSCALDAVAGRRAARDAVSKFPSSLLQESRLRAFVALVETGNLSLAAEKRAVTLLAMSRSINELERSLDMKLFTRTPGAIVPTEPGRLFYIHVERTFFELAQIEPELDALRTRSAAS